MGGDFNLPDINWEKLTVQRGSNKTSQCHELIEMCEDASLHQVQYNPTRGDNILDLVFTDNPTLVKECNTAPGISDHDLIIIDQLLQPARSKNKRRKIHLYQRADWHDIKDSASELCHNLYNKHREMDVETLWQQFKEGVMDIINNKISSKMTSGKTNKPWITNEIKKSMKKKTKLFKKAKNSKKDEDIEAYKQLKSRLQKEIRKTHWKYLNDTFQDALLNKNNKAFWKYIKSKRKDDVGVSPLKQGTKLFYDSGEKANILNKQFESVFTKEDDTRSIPTPSFPQFPEIDHLFITEKGVEKLLSEIKTSKACGPDKLPNIFLKTCSKEIAPLITKIYQKSLHTGQLPLDWRKANVTPIFKKDNKHDPSNYRPVSLTCVCCKILEHIICRHLLKHLEAHNILTHRQHGFRSGHSCETQLLITAQDLMKNYDESRQTDVIILDFSKAFDTVPHRSLLHKLDRYGIQGPIWTWIGNFLMDRYQQVVVEGECSNTIKVESGVPQGTVLGPLLFLCHINDLPNSINQKTEVRMFADDCLLYRRIDNVSDQQQLQKDLSSLETWATDWGMQFNTKKCFVLRIPRKKEQHHFYELNKHILKQVNENPYLGVQLDDQLKWDAHINNTVKKANSLQGLLRRNLKHCPKQCKDLAFRTIIRPTLEYGSVVWDPHLKTHKEKLEKVQRRGARFVNNRYGRDADTNLYMEQLNWTSLESRRKELRLTTMYKIINGLVAIPIEDYAKQNTGKTRAGASNQYQTIRSTTDTHKHSFFPRTIREWNQLSYETKMSPTADIFKVKVKAAVNSGV